MNDKMKKELEDRELEQIWKELDDEDIEGIDEYIKSQDDKIKDFLKSEFYKNKKSKKNKINKENNFIKEENKKNNDESWMKEYLDFYDNAWEYKLKNSNKNKENYKKSDLHYKICRYEIFLILLFISFIYFSTHYERNFWINFSWLTLIWTLSWFSSNMNIPDITSNWSWFIWMVFNIIDDIEHIINFKKYILFDIFFACTILVMCWRGWIAWTWDYLTMWILLLTPIWYFIWLFIKRLYDKFKGKSKK